jgi:hypothetical protein
LLEISDDLRSPQNLPRTSRAHPSAPGGIWHPLAHASADGITLDEVNDRLYAPRGDTGSAATSVSFARLQGCYQ